MADSGPVDDRAPTGAFAGPADAVLLSQAFAAATITTVRRAVAARVATAGLSGDSLEGFVLAVHELVANAVRHGGGAGRIHLRQQGGTLICEISDQGPGAARLPAGLPAAHAPGGRGLWLAHHLTGSLHIDTGPTGLSVTVSIHLPSLSESGPTVLPADTGRSGPTPANAGRSGPTPANAGWTGPTPADAGWTGPGPVDAGWTGPGPVDAGWIKPGSGDVSWSGPVPADTGRGGSVPADAV